MMLWLVLNVSPDGVHVGCAHRESAVAFLAGWPTLRTHLIKPGVPHLTFFWLGGAFCPNNENPRPRPKDGLERGTLTIKVTTGPPRHNRSPVPFDSAQGRLLRLHSGQAPPRSTCDYPLV